MSINLVALILYFGLIQCSGSFHSLHTRDTRYQDSWQTYCAAFLVRWFLRSDDGVRFLFPSMKINILWEWSDCVAEHTPLHNHLERSNLKRYWSLFLTTAFSLPGDGIVKLACVALACCFRYELKTSLWRHPLVPTPTPVWQIYPSFIKAPPNYHSITPFPLHHPSIHLSIHPWNLQCWQANIRNVVWWQRMCPYVWGCGIELLCLHVSK